MTVGPGYTLDLKYFAHDCRFDVFCGGLVLIGFTHIHQVCPSGTQIRVPQRQYSSPKNQG